MLNGDPRDGLDAAERARRGYRAGWHPVLAAVEGPPGVWTMTSPDGRRYAVIALLEIGGERGYRAVTWAERSEERELIGYRTTLRAACKAAHDRYLAAHGPNGFAPNPWPGSVGARTLAGKPSARLSGREQTP